GSASIHPAFSRRGMKSPYRSRVSGRLTTALADYRLEGSDMTTFKRLVCALTLLSAASFGGISIATAAEACPARFIKMIVPNPAGGVGDLIARALGEKVGSELGKAVVVENRAGATTVIGTEAVSRAKPD